MVSIPVSGQLRRWLNDSDGPGDWKIPNDLYSLYSSSVASQHGTMPLWTMQNFVHDNTTASRGSRNRLEFPKILEETSQFFDGSWRKPPKISELFKEILIHLPTLDF